MIIRRHLKHCVKKHYVKRSGTVAEQCGWVLLSILVFLLAMQMFPNRIEAQENPVAEKKADELSSTPNRPQFQRVFVPEDQVGKLVPRDFMPIAVNDLESLLEKYESGEGLELDGLPKLSRAIYTARLQDEMILSDFNLFEIDYQDDVAGYLPIKPSNLAISNPANNPLRDLLGWGEAAQWYTDSNGLQLLPIQDSTPLWFGWRGAVQDAKNNSKYFSLQVPLATRNQLLLMLDSRTELQCGQAVVREIQINAIEEELDGVKRTEFYQALRSWYDRDKDTNSRLWLVEFSSDTRLNLFFQAKLAEPYLNRQGAIASLLQQYRMGENGVDLATRIAFLEPIQESELFLKTEGSIKVRDIKLGEETLPWRTTNSNPAIIRIDLTGIAEASRSQQLQISSFINEEQWSMGILPSISLSDAIILKGDTILECRPTSVPLGIEASGCEAIAVTDGNLGVQRNPSRWQWRWSGELPKIKISLQQLARDIHATSLTRINLVRGSVNATAWVRLSPQIASGGEAIFQLGEGWILDNLSPEIGSKLQINDTVLSDGTEITLRWESYTSDEALTFELQAHRAIETDIAEINISEMPFLQLKAGTHSGFVAVETTGRYLLKPTPLMLSSLVEEQVLAAWQQSKLPRFSRSWLLQASEGRLPELSFTSEPSTFTGKWDVEVKPEANGVTEEYSLQFRPLFGAMDRVLVRFRNAGGEGLLWQWDEGGKPYLLQAIREVNESGSESYSIVLPRPMNEPFVIKAKRSVASKDWINIPLPTSDQATSEELVLNVSKLLDCRLPETGWISVLDSVSRPSGEFVTFRAESNLADVVSIRLQDFAANQKVWATFGYHQARYFLDGGIYHRSEWMLKNCRGNTLQVQIPEKATLLEMFFEDELISHTQNPTNKNFYVINLPDNIDSGRFSVTYSEQTTRLAFRNQISISRARIDCGVVQFSDELLTPKLFSLVRPEDFSLLYGENPLKQVTNILLECMFAEYQSTSTFAISDRSRMNNQPKMNWSDFDGLSDWNRFSLISHSETEEKLAASAVSIVTLWDTRFLRTLTLMLSLIAGVISFWLWLRFPKILCGCSLILLATSLTFSGTIVFISVFLLLILLIAWLSALARLGLRFFAAKPQYPNSKAAYAMASRTNTALLGLIGLLSFSGTILTYDGDAAAQDSTDGTYGILIPISPQGEVKGNYVYIPIEAYNFLTNPTGKTLFSRTPYLIRQASYQFRASESITTLGEINYQLIADYEIEVLDASSPVRWPIGSGRAALERLVVNQFEIIPGFTVRQDELAILWYPERTGVFRIRLQLNPISTSTEVDQFDIPIPLVPTSSITTLVPSEKNVKVNGVLSEPIAGLPPSYQVGEQSRLSITVLDQSDSIETPEPLDTELDSWIHFQGKQAFLLTQLRMRYSDSTVPKKIGLQMNDGWVPVGLNWGDAKWNGLADPRANGLLNYELDIQSTSMTEAVIYTAWKPTGDWLRDGAEPALFPESSLINPLQYSLAISSTPDSSFSLNVPENWLKDDEDRTFSRWQERGLSLVNQSYRSNSRALMPSILNREIDNRPSISERSDVIVRSEHFELNYEATWDRQGAGTELVLLVVPDKLQVQALTLNGTSREDFRIVNDGSKTYIAITHSPSNTQESNSISCKAIFPLEANASQLIPRITSSFGKLSSSLFRLYRETNLVLQVEDIDYLPDSRKMLERSTEELLKSNQVGIMEVDLTNHFVGLSQLPTRLLVDSPSGIEGSTLGLVFSNNDRWRYTLIAKLKSSQAPLDSVVFELPTSITSQLEIYPPCPFRLDPSPDGSHQLLSLFPTSPITDVQTHVIAFDLNRLSGQVSLPQVSLVGGATLTQRIGLPQVGGQHNYAWRTTGLRPEPIDAELERSLAEIDGAAGISFQFLEPTSRRYQADMQSDKSNRPRMSAKLVTHAMEFASPNEFIMKSTYWIDPEGFLAARFKIPNNLVLLGALENGEPQAIQRDVATGIQSISIQPSNLPTKLELILKSAAINSTEDYSIQLPVGVNLDVERCLVKILPHKAQTERLQYALVKLDGELASALSSDTGAEIEVNSIAFLLNESDATIGSYQPKTLGMWSRAWTKELRENPDATAANDLAKRWLEQMDSMLSEPSEDADSVLSTNWQAQKMLVFAGTGQVSSLDLVFEKLPLQVHLSNIVALGVLLIGLGWLAMSGKKFQQLLDRAAQFPALPLLICGFLFCLLFGSKTIGVLAIGLALVSLVVQMFRKLLMRSKSSNTFIASQRKIAS